MKFNFLIPFFAFAFFLIIPGLTQPVSTQVYFSPHGGCTEAVVDAINAARGV